MKNVVIAITDKRRLRVYIVTMWNNVDMKNVARIWIGRPYLSKGIDQNKNGSCLSVHVYMSGMTSLA